MPALDEGLGNSAYLVNLVGGRALAVDVQPTLSRAGQPLTATGSGQPSPPTRTYTPASCHERAIN